MLLVVCVYSVLVGIWLVTFYYAVAQAVRSHFCSHFSASLALLFARLVCCRVGMTTFEPPVEGLTEMKGLYVIVKLPI